MKKKSSIEQIETNPKRAGVDFLAADGVLIWFKVLAAKNASLYLILWIVVLNLWTNRERVNAYIAHCGASLAELRFTNGRPIPAPVALVNDQGFHSALVKTEFVKPQDRIGSTHTDTHRFSGSGYGILQNVGLAVYVSDLSFCLRRDSPNQPPSADQCASLGESNEYRLAGEQRRFPFYLEILAGVFLCGLISWVDAVWPGRC